MAPALVAPAIIVARGQALALAGTIISEASNMDFTFTPEENAWRQEVREFIARELPPDIGAGEDAYSDEYWPAALGFRRKLGQKGWTGIGWPKEYGGLGASIMRQVILNEEMVYNRAPLDPQAYQVGPAIIAHGSEDLKRRFLSATAKQEIVWCQGFSEPNSGSDLASLQTRAVKDGDDYLITGSKIWTSLAHRADWIHILCRTDPDAPKHRGITYFIADMHSPGVTIRPLVNMAGTYGFNQVFFDNVRVPRGNILGEENRGWYVATTTLANERSGIVQVSGARRTLDDLAAFMRRAGPSPAVRREPAIKHRLAELAIEAAVGRNLAYRVGWMQHAGIVPFDMQASISKNFASELTQRVAQAGMQALGLYGQLLRGSRSVVLDGLLPGACMGTIASTIAAGTSEVNRNIIATRGLGLPRG